MGATRTLEHVIVQMPGVHGGRPIIAGHGVTVRAVATYYKQGLTPEEIADALNIPFAGVYAALAYYHLNQEMIESDMAANTESAVKQALGL